MAPRILKISAKCSDLFDAEFVKDGKRVGYEGYVVNGIGIGGGDYVELQLDIDSGKIIGFDRGKAKKLFDKVMDRGKYYSGLEDEKDLVPEKKLNLFRGQHYLAIRLLSPEGESNIASMSLELPLFVEDGVDPDAGTPVLDDEGFPIRGAFDGWIADDEDFEATRIRHPKGAPTLLVDDAGGFPHEPTAKKWLDVNTPGYHLKSTRDGEVVAIWFKTADDRQKFVDVGFGEVIDDRFR